MRKVQDNKFKQKDEGASPNPDLGEPWQVDHGEGEDVGAVELEVDGLGADPLVAAGHVVRLSLDLPPDLVPVSEHLQYVARTVHLTGFTRPIIR